MSDRRVGDVRGTEMAAAIMTLSEFPGGLLTCYLLSERHFAVAHFILKRK